MHFRLWKLLYFADEMRTSSTQF